MTFKIAIIGRPNVGKSSLFNRIIGKKQAIVDDTPGVTRDWRLANAKIKGIPIEIIDTAGLEHVIEKGSIGERMRTQTEKAVAIADLVLMVVDGSAGITPVDAHFANWIRKVHKHILLVANKCDTKRSEAGILEAYSLGLGEPIAVSAEHGIGFADLNEAILSLLPPAEEEATEEEKPDVLQMAIVGRPNVGKSTLLNALIGDERVITGPEAGLTRDAIAIDWMYSGRHVRLVDTAGLRRRARIEQRLEKLSVSDTIKTIDMSEVVVLVVDAQGDLDNQDLTIARTVIDEGRALVIALNKWDAVEDKPAALKKIKERIEDSLQQAKGVPIIPLSALHAQKLDKLMAAVFEMYDIWNTRISTSKLNRWLGGALAAHQPPVVGNRRIKIRYMTQVKARPPTFALWLSKPVEIPDSYLRYLINGIRETFNMRGVPIRLLLRKGENPYGTSRQ